MEYYKEEDFYKDNSGPTEHYQYSSYIFWQDSQSEQWGQDYDQFVCVINAFIPYIRKVEKRGQCMSPCGGSPYPSTDGMFAQKTPEERDLECPKIAFGVIASFLINLRYDNNQQDFVPTKEPAATMQEYYNRFRDLYMNDHSGLKYQDLSYEQKELSFIDDHLQQEQLAWDRSDKLKGYSMLYGYAMRFYSDYLRFIEIRKRELKAKTMPSKIRYSISKSSVSGNEYLKVFLMEQDEVQNVQAVLNTLPTIRKVNITQSQSADHPGDTLTVYPKSMCSCKEVESEIKKTLDSYQSNVTVGSIEKDCSAHFAEIESQILQELDEAQAMIDVCVAWFTNDKLRDKLLEKQAEGIKVRVIIYRDGVNSAHGVDLSQIEHKELRGERGGLMHDKFCVVDNVTTITGSYNWTNNAEFKNDENIAI